MGHEDLFEAWRVQHGEGSPTPGGLGLECSSRAKALANLDKTSWRRAGKICGEDLGIREKEEMYSGCILGVCAVCACTYMHVCVICTHMHVWALLRDWWN